METKHALMAAALVFCVCSCGGDTKNPYGSNGVYGMMENDREFGVIQSMQVGDRIQVNNAGQAIAGAQYNNAVNAGAAAATSATSGGILSPLSSVFSSAGSMFHSNTQPANADIASEITYVIKTDNGQEVTIKQIPVINEPIVYPGQRVMIQKNGDYVRVYPANEENLLDPSQSLGSQPHR